MNKSNVLWLVKHIHTWPYERHSLLPHNEAAFCCSGFMPGDWCATDLLPSPYTPTIAHWALFRSVMHNVYTHHSSNVYSLSFVFIMFQSTGNKTFFFFKPIPPAIYSQCVPNGILGNHCRFVDNVKRLSKYFIFQARGCPSWYFFSIVLFSCNVQFRLPF